MTEIAALIARIEKLEQQPAIWQDILREDAVWRTPSTPYAAFCVQVASLCRQALRR